MISLLSSIALWIIDLEMFPLFDIAHDYLATVDVRKTWGANFARENTFYGIASWTLTILCIYAGSMIANYLIGQHIFAALSDISLLILATFVWLSVSYAPYDAVYRIGETFPVKLTVNILKEIYRAKKVRNAIFQMWYFYPSYWFVSKILIGVIRGNGAGVVKQIWQLIQKVLSPNSAIIVETSLSTKSCFLASIIYLVKLNTDLIPVSHELIHLGIVIFFVVGKMSNLLLQKNIDSKMKGSNRQSNKTEKSLKKGFSKKQEAKKEN